MVRVIGIDPGYDRLGVAVLEGTTHVHHLVFSTCITTDKNLPFVERLLSAGNVLTELILKYKPSRIGIETLVFNKNQKTAIMVAEARGMVLYIAAKEGLAVCEYSPQAIKVATTGYGASTKEEVTTMVRRLVKNVPITALDDEYDAIAAALTCLVSRSS